MELTSAHLFCGGGGDTQGAIAAGYKPVWAIEFDKYAAAVYRFRFSETLLIEQNIKSLTDDYIKTFPIPAIIIAGSPCQDFSISGNRSGLAGTRGELFFELCRFLRLLQPPMFIWENVSGALSSGGGQDFKKILGSFAQLGYLGAYHSSGGSETQSRKRVFCVGLHWRYSDSFSGIAEFAANVG
jgi:DNA (cytosine-5)-methyltransferase 1